jgi:hypothetical protein
VVLEKQLLSKGKKHELLHQYVERSYSGYRSRLTILSRVFSISCTLNGSGVDWAGRALKKRLAA